MAGSATLTTVLSMKARLEPRIVAASIQGRAWAPHGSSREPERIMVSSQGVRTITRRYVTPGSIGCRGGLIGEEVADASLRGAKNRIGASKQSNRGQQQERGGYG